MFYNDLKFSDHINEICQKGFQRISFKFVALSFACMFLAPYTSLVHPVLENCTKRTVKRSKEGQLSLYNYAVKDLEYPSRLKHLKLPSLGYRRKRADILRVFRYCKGFDLQNGDQLFIVGKSVKTRVTINQAENLVLRAITYWNSKCHTSRNFNSF